MELSIEKFSPTKAELAKLAEEAKALNLPDAFDEAQYGRVKAAKLNLVHVRNDITKTGKAMRDDANAFRNAVIEKEKEFVAIIKPAEDRLDTLLNEADHIIERKARVELLPARMAKLEAIADGLPFPGDDVLLDMDGPAFEGYCNQRVADKNEKDRLYIEGEKQRVAEEKAQLEREKEMREREEKARQDERERLAREQKEKEEREAREKKEAEERVEREKAEAELKAKQEQEKLESNKRYQAFLEKHGYVSDGTFFVFTDTVNGEVKLYKLVGVHKLK